MVESNVTKEFKYQKEGLTTDIVEFLMKDYELNLGEAFDTLYESDTYSKICDPSTGLYYQSSKYVYTYLQNELQCGRMS